MMNQTPTDLSIIPYHQNILLPNIHNQPDNSNPIPRRNIVSNLFEEFQRQYTTQELLTAIFIRIMTITSFSHLVLGLRLLDETLLSSSISPLAMSLFKYFLAILTSFSASSAVDQYSCLFKIPMRRKTRVFAMYLILPIAHLLSPVAEKHRRIFYYMTDFLYLVCVGDFSTELGPQGWLLRFGLYCFMQIIIFPIKVRVDTSSEMGLVISGLATAFWAAKTSLDHLTSPTLSLNYFLHKSIQKLVPLATARVKSAFKGIKIRKLVKYAICLVGTLIFQNFFRLKTFAHVKAFMYLAVSWLANLALLNASDDFGILNFLLANMILGSTVSQFGLKMTTWFTYGVCLFLYALSVKLKSMNISKNLERMPSPRPHFLFWIFYCCIVLDTCFSHYFTKI